MKYSHIRMLLVLTLMFTWLGFRSVPASAAGSCKNVACEGLFAAAMGCGGSTSYTAGNVKILPDSF